MHCRIRLQVIATQYCNAVARMQNRYWHSTRYGVTIHCHIPLRHQYEAVPSKKDNNHAQYCHSQYGYK